MSINDVFGSADIYKDLATRRTRARGENGEQFATERKIPYYQTVDGMLRRTWIGKNRDENWENETVYLFFVPELNQNTDMNIAPPMERPPYLWSALVYESSRTPYGVPLALPNDLREIPLSLNSQIEDGSIANTFNPGKYNTHEDTGRIKQETRHFLLIVRQYKDFDPELAVLVLRPGEMAGLATSLQFHLQYRDNLIGVPMRFVKIPGGVEVVIDKEKDEIDMGEYPVHDLDGNMLITKHLAAVRSEYEKFLLNNGWKATDVTVAVKIGSDTLEVKARHNWTMAEDDSDFVQPVTAATVEAVETPAEPETPAGPSLSVSELSEMTNTQLRALAKEQGIKLRPNTSRAVLIDTLAGAPF